MLSLPAMPLGFSRLARAWPSMNLDANACNVGTSLRKDFGRPSTISRSARCSPALRLMVDGLPKSLRKEVPTLQAFASRFMDGHARANREKPSGIAGKESILRVHLQPVLGTRKLDAITNEDVQR